MNSAVYTSSAPSPRMRTPRRFPDVNPARRASRSSRRRCSEMPASGELDPLGTCARPPSSGRNPQSWPITSTMKQCAVTAACLILSTAATMVFSAVSAPMLMSEAGRSLSIEAGMHTIGIARPL